MSTDNSRRLSVGGVPIKYLSLIVLTFQNSAFILIMHYSRIMPLVNGHRYFTSTAVLMSEVIKLAVSLSLALYDIATTSKTYETSTMTGMFNELARVVFTGDSWKLAIPAALYTLQNTLQYVAVSNLDAATFQVTYQLKILTTAMFSVIMLGKVLSLRKWLSLGMLMVGVAIVQIPTEPAKAPHLTVKDLYEGRAFHSPRSIWDLKSLGNVAAGQLSRRSATYEGIDQDVAKSHPEFNASVGLMAVCIACLLSGLAGVYFEKIIKENNASKPSIWVRNVQLAFYSIWPALFIGVLFKDGEQVAKVGFFAGYNIVVWISILFQATGGIIVAIVVQYTDNIMKNFATSISIILSCVASVYFFDFKITVFFMIGTAVVIGATYLYNAPVEDKKVRLPPIFVSDEEKNGQGSYFDLEPAASEAKSPLMKGEAFSSSRPGTPTYERGQHRSRSQDPRPAKRNQ